MNIGILVLFVNSYGKKGLYNSQEIGMARELASRGHRVTIYKCVDSSQNRTVESISDNITYHLEPVKNLGNNAITNFNWLDKTLDALISCSDIQLLTSKAYRWAKRHSVIFLPYIGIAHSNSLSTPKRFLSNLLAVNSFRTYKKTKVIAKTNAVKNELNNKGIKNVSVAPVGLDFDLLKKDYADVSRELLLSELDLEKDTKYILIVGRLSHDRNPLDVIPVLSKVNSNDPNTRLIVIGKGPLKQALQDELLSKGLSDSVIWIDQVNNSEMWKYYRIADALVTFSKGEIFGMSILEAMFYELPVYAINAPGPNDIIVHGKTGYLFKTPEEMADSITLDIPDSIGKMAHQRVIADFSWKHWADIIEKEIEN